MTKQQRMKTVTPTVQPQTKLNRHHADNQPEHTRLSRQLHTMNFLRDRCVSDDDAYMLGGLPAWTAHSEYQKVWAGPPGEALLEV
jgi:hypothetical protein